MLLAPEKKINSQEETQNYSRIKPQYNDIKRKILSLMTERREKHLFCIFSFDLLQHRNEVEFQQGKT